MPSASKLIVCGLLAAAAPVAVGAVDVVNPSECDCFVVTNEKGAGNQKVDTYYREHEFWDFRSLDKYAGVPALKNTAPEAEAAPPTSDYFADSGSFSKFWRSSKWTQSGNLNQKYTNVYTRNNLYIEKSNEGQGTYLTMRTARKADHQSSAEIESKQTHHYASIRAEGRTIGSAGACMGIFTYLNTDPEGQGRIQYTQEADIEILTGKPKDTMYYTNQPAYDPVTDSTRPGSQKVAAVPGYDWQQWATHRLDWTPQTTFWHLDGKETHENSFQVPIDPAQIMFNMWGNGDPGWSGEMPVGSAAYQQFKWIQLLLNPAAKETCSRVCSIDKSPQLGKAVRV